MSFSFSTLAQRFNYKNLKKQFKTFLIQGIMPKELAFTISLGILIGIMPAIGFTTFLCALSAIVFRLNMAVIQLVNLTIYPLQLILYIPFIQIGQTLFKESLIPFSVFELIKMFTNNFWNTLIRFGYANILGLGVWAILAIPLGFFLYFLFYKILKKTNFLSAWDKFKSN